VKLGPGEIERYLRTIAPGITAATRDACRQITAAGDAIAHLAMVDARSTSLPELKEQTQILAEVQEGLLRGELNKLPRRHGRIALHCFDRFHPDDVRRLAGRFGGQHLVQSFFERRLDPAVQSHWAAVVGELAGSDSLLSNHQLDREVLLQPNAFRSALALAELVPARRSLRDVVRGLCQPGLLRPRWPYTRLTLAFVAQDSARAPGELWREMQADPFVEAMLLPDGTPIGVSRFRRAERLPPVLGCYQATALAGARLIEDEIVGFGAGALWHEAYLRDPDFRDPREFRDPRRNPETRGWKFVQQTKPAAYERFIDTLLTEDIEFFFERANLAGERRDFWKQYLRQLNATRCYLNPGDHAAMQREYAAAPEKMQGVARRALRLKSGEPNALCLVFPTAVVVEFATKGHAAYFYSLAEFDRVLSTNPRTARDLKHPELGGKQSHMGAWESAFALRLREYGVPLPS
jgi:hypothetical protein